MEADFAIRDCDAGLLSPRTGDLVKAFGKELAPSHIPNWRHTTSLYLSPSLSGGELLDLLLPMF